ncbi:MAG: hydrogenase maturation protease [Bacteroidales bacterium]|nr:hydrogenase maturation protease [Bacteroidales bacterium]
MFKELNNILSQRDKKKLFVGIGNLLKMDDGVGVYISKKIKNKKTVSSLTAETSIENYIGKINSLKPDILVLIDCADIKSPAGTFKLLTLSQIQDITFNTHNISLRRLSEFFRMPVYVLGIQPEKIDFGENISYIVKNVAYKIIKQINKEEVHHGC